VDDVSHLLTKEEDGGRFPGNKGTPTIGPSQTATGGDDLQAVGLVHNPLHRRARKPSSLKIMQTSTAPQAAAPAAAPPNPTPWLLAEATDDEAKANSAGIDDRMSQLEASMRSAVEQSVARTRDVLLHEIREQQGTMADMLTAQQHQAVYPSAASPPPVGATTVRDRDERTKDVDDREPKRIRVDYEDEDRESKNPFQSESGALLPPRVNHFALFGRVPPTARRVDHESIVYGDYFFVRRRLRSTPQAPGRTTPSGEHHVPD